jgi:hypothetical protein
MACVLNISVGDDWDCVAAGVKLGMTMLIKACAKGVTSGAQQQYCHTCVQGLQQCPTCQMLKVGGSSGSLAGIISMVLSTESSGSSRAAAAM